MKQFLFMAITMFLGTGGTFTLTPVLGIAVYYTHAVLRPQFIWDWVDLFGVKLGEVNWSLPVAVCTLVTTLLWRSGLWTPMLAAKQPWYGNPQFTRSHYLFLGFTAWISLTYVTAVLPDVAWPFFIEYVKIFVMFLCATLVLRTVRDLWIIYFVVLGSVAYIAYELNFFYLVYRWMMLQQRGYGGLDNNGAAMFLAMAIPLAYFAWEATARWWRWAYLAVIPLLGHAVLLSYSRGAMLSLIPTALLMWWRSRHKMFLGLAYVAAGVIIFTTTSKEIGDRFTSTFTSAHAEQQGQRFQTWGIAWRMTNDRPMFGWGIRVSPSFTYSQYGADIPGRAIHSQYLQTAADSGWPALGLYIALLGSVFYGLWQTRKMLRRFNDPETQGVRSLAAGLECSLLLFCIGATFLSLEHFEMPYIVILLSVQLHSITKAITAKLNPSPSGLPPLTLPYPYPASQQPVAVSS